MVDCTSTEADLRRAEEEEEDEEEEDEDDEDEDEDEDEEEEEEEEERLCSRPEARERIQTRGAMRPAGRNARLC